MQLLPSLDITNPCIHNLTSIKALILAIFTYTLTAWHVCLLYLCIRNSYLYLCKQKKYKVYPLSIFYFFSILLFATRIYWCIWIVQIKVEMQVNAITYPAAFKFCIGCTQVLAMGELTVRIDQSLEVCEIADKDKIIKMNQRAERKIVTARILLTIVIVFSMLITIISNSLVMINNENEKTRAQENAEFLYKVIVYYGAIFLLVTILLAITFSCVIYKLRQKFNIHEIFANEMKSLSIIYGFFCLSFLLRTAKDFYIPFTEYTLCEERDGILIGYTSLWISEIETMIYDILPIGSIILFHVRNFSVPRESVDAGEGGDQSHRKKRPTSTASYFTHEEII